MDVRFNSGCVIPIYQKHRSGSCDGWTSALLACDQLPAPPISQQAVSVPSKSKC